MVTKDPLELRESEVVVIGGGIIGASIAYYLSKGGKQVALVEREDIAAGTSSACDGAVLLQSKHPGVHLELAMESARLYSTLSEELGCDVHYRQHGGTVVIRTREEWQAMQDWVAKQRRTGLQVELLGKKETLELHPMLSEDVLGCAYSPLDGDVYPMAVALAYASAARRLGAHILTRTRVTGILLEGGRVTGVVTDRGTIRTGMVVNCAGAWASQVAQLVGVEVPIRPRKGQLVVTEKLPPIQKGVILSAEYMAIKYNPELVNSTTDPFVRRSISLVMEQTFEGNLVIGGNREFVGYDRRVDPNAISGILQNALSWVPGLAGVNVIRTFAGLRPYTPDGLPILGPVPGVRGFYMAAGHEGDGIALAPVTGVMMAEFLIRGRTEYPIELFSLERFSAGVA